jgi:alcohol dehydrogenase class IV
MAYHSGHIFDYEDEKPGSKPIDQAIPYWVALPTTAGTGSEVGRSTVISDAKTHVKKIIFSPRLLAQAVFADPELTLPLPQAATAATGMDALTHCIESYLAKGYHPICDGIALEGLRLAAENLEKAVYEPTHLEARGAMLMSSMMGAIAFQKGLGLTHSCAHALSTVIDLHHGLANGIMIDHALSFNTSVAKPQFQRMLTVIGALPTPGDPLHTEVDPFIRWLSELKAKIGIPKKLSEVGVKKDMIATLAARAFEDSCHVNNPRPCTLTDFTNIFTNAF